MKNKFKKGFTLTELLIAIAIIGILSGIVIMGVGNAKKNAKNEKKIADLIAIQLELERYYAKHGRYPDSDSVATDFPSASGASDDGCGGWDIGNSGHPFMTRLSDFIGYALPVDSDKSDACAGYFYYRYNSTWSTIDGCDGRPFYVLGTTLDGSYGSVDFHKNSPGWKCSNRDWQNELAWVTGKFE